MHQSTASSIDLDRIRSAVMPVLAAHDISLVDLEWLTTQIGWTLRLTIEREGTNAELGVTLDDCAIVSRDVSAVLDVEDLVAHRYHLEVSSPGLDRRLRTDREFERFVGRTVKVKLSRATAHGHRVLHGILEKSPTGRVAVNVDGHRIEVDLGDIADARLAFELSPQPKKRAKKKRATKVDPPGVDQERSKQT